MGNVTSARVIALQRAAGNRATVALLGGPAPSPRRTVARSKTSRLQKPTADRAATQAVGRMLQRQPVKTPPAKKPPPKPPTTAERLKDLETRQTTLEKRTAIIELDLRYRALFAERMSSYKGAVLRIAGGLNAAQKGFKDAQEKQAQFEALVTQLVIAAGAIGLAFGFEPLLSAGLGRLGRTTTQIEKTVEFWENPVLQAAGSTSNIYPAAKGSRDTDVPADVGPMAFLTANLEELELHNQGLERAFATRAGGIKAADNAKLDALDVNGWEGLYASLLAALNAACKGVEAMKSKTEVARILESYIWAGWIRQQAKTLVNMGRGTAEYPAGKPDPSKPRSPGVSYGLDLGSFVEDRLNEIGVSKQAGVTLSGHWYSGNDPDDWKERLITWAWNYNEVIGVAPPQK